MKVNLCINKKFSELLGMIIMLLAELLYALKC